MNKAEYFTWKEKVVSEHISPATDEKHLEMEGDDPEILVAWVEKHPDAILTYSRPNGCPDCPHDLSVPQ